MTGRRNLPTASRTSRRMLGIVAGSLVAVAAMFSTASAGEQHVALGEVRSEVARTDMDMTALLRSTTEKELAKIESKTQGKRKAVLSMALLSMTTNKGPKGAVDTCRVVATVRDAQKGALLATFETKTHIAHGNHSADMDRAMVQSAVQGIVGRVPSALK